jgi:NAD-dependent dihydropyrimidine dehydrogenase PreA subunit
MQCDARSIVMLVAPMTVSTTDEPPSAVKPLASLPRVDRHKPKGTVRASRLSRRRALVLVLVHVVIGLHVWHWLATGSSLTPVEPSEAKETLEQGRINAGFVLFAVLIAGTLVFGRWFCGWACHVVALQDLSAWLLGKAGFRPKPVRSRLLVLAPWVVAFHMFAWPHVRHWFGSEPLPDTGPWQWHLTTDSLWRTFPGPIMAIGTLLVVGFLVVWWLGAKGFCTYGCPYGAFFAVADRVAPMRIKVTDACDACGHCTHVCSSNVRVHEEVARHGRIVDPGCMKCLDCVSVCPKEALYVGFAAPKPLVSSQQRLQVRADFSWPEEALLGLVAFVAAEWTFRGAWFGEGVPFLMAVGLGVITAVLVLLGLRLLRRRDVTFQHTVLKQGGRWSGRGRLAFVFLTAWLLFTAHTFVGQRLNERATEATHEPVRSAFYGSRRVEPASLEAAIVALDRTTSWALVADPAVLEKRALALRGLGRHAEAERALLDLRATNGGLGLLEANLALAAYCMDDRRQRFDDARQLLEVAGRLAPDNPITVLLQQRLAQFGR